MKNLIPRYSVTQFMYWTFATGTAAFATTYLLKKGIPSEQVGILLALAGLLSCLTQPLIASYADRSKRFILPQMLIVLTVLCCACSGLQLVSGMPLLFCGLVYTVGIWSGDTMLPLLNALSVAYTEAGYPMNYGVARGIGSVASAISSLVLGYIIARLGTTWMFLYLIGAQILCIITFLGYPHIQKEARENTNTEKGGSIFYFFHHYPWYSLSLLGILFLGMFHAMTENYLIAIMGALGGNSSHVGTAIFIAAMVGAPVIFCFNKIHKHIRNANLLKIAAISFLIKAVCFYFARSITTIYLLQLLQITSYSFLAPTQVFYANEKVENKDMVKGQAFSTAAYALGCSAGNFAGGQLLGFGVKALLFAGIMMALTGTILIFVTVTKSDRNRDDS